MTEDSPLAATMTVDAELTGTAIIAQIVRFDIPEPTASIHAIADRYYLNMCLTPRPLTSRGRGSGGEV